jgi:hypothetical protein
MIAKMDKMDANQHDMEATIRSGQEETKTGINSIRSELEETIKTRMEYVVVSLSQHSQGLREELDEKIMETQRHVQVVQASIDTWTGSLQGDITDVKKDLQKELDIRAQGLEVRMAEVEARVELGVSGHTGNDARRAKPPKFDGSTSWAMFRRHFETVAEHNCWMPREKVTYLIAALQGRACDVLHGAPRGAMYEETFEALEDRFGDQHLAAAYRSQLKTQTQKAGESLQEFAAAIEQLAHRHYPALPEDHVRKDVGRAFTDGVEDPDLKIQLLLGGEKTINEALRQAVFLAARPQKTLWRNQSPPTRQGDHQQSVCWDCGKPGHVQVSCRYRRTAKYDNHHVRQDDRPPRDKREHLRWSKGQTRNNREADRRGGQPSGNERVPAERGNTGASTKPPYVKYRNREDWEQTGRSGLGCGQTLLDNHRHRSSSDCHQTRYCSRTAREGTIHKVRSADGIRGDPPYFEGGFRDTDPGAAPIGNLGIRH